MEFIFERRGVIAAAPVAVGALGSAAFFQLYDAIFNFARAGHEVGQFAMLADFLISRLPAIVCF